MFLPTIPIGIDIRLDDLMALFLIPLLLLVRPNFKVNRLVLSYSLILLLFLLSTVYGYSFLSVPTSLRDVNEFVRVIKPLLIIVAVSYCDSNSLSIKLNTVFKYGAILIIAIGFLEFFDFPGYRKLISIIYSGHRFENLDRARAVLTAGDPNIAAALIIYFITYILQSMLMTKHKIRNSILLLFLMIVLLMTSSRTLLVVFIVILFISLFFHFKKNRFFTFMILTLSFALLIPLVQFFDYIIIGFSTFSEGTNTSMLLRYKQWAEAYALFLKSPIIGWGPAKAIHTTIVDSEHLLLLRRYGVLGYLAVFNFIFGYIWVVFKKRRKFRNMDLQHKRLAITSLFSCLMIFIVMTTNNFFSGYQLIPLFVVMITVVENKLSNI
ncbi:MAG: O-antigen ligase family protein [Flavobacteriales bacterium]